MPSGRILYGQSLRSLVILYPGLQKGKGAKPQWLDILGDSLVQPNACHCVDETRALRKVKPVLNHFFSVNLFFLFSSCFFSFSFSLLDILFFNLFILFFSFLETEFHVVPAGFNLFSSRGKSWTLTPLFLPPKDWDSRHEAPPLALTVFLTEIQIHLRIQKCIIRHVLCADIHAYVHGGYWSTSSVILWEIQSYFCETESLTGLWGLPVGYTNYLVSLKDPLVSTSPIITSSCYSLLLSTWVLRIEL